ncbi:transketolase [Lutispora sp.]|uniref:transketolase n=1 Tax=Lutispora sp. TaxID=2828727 RepID=UPI0035634354
MALDFVKEKELQELSKNMRIEIIEMLNKVKTGHPGGSLSAVEIMAVLYFNQMNIDPQNPQWEDRDRFIAGKGHCAPIVYVALAERGYFPKEELRNLRQMGSILQGHPCMLATPGVDMSSGPLGLGLSAGVGMGIAAKLNKKDYYTYVLLGDGEIQEGQVWEAAMSAVKFKIDNVITILDNNGVQLDGTNDEIMPLGDIGKKFESFGWNVIHIDGHSIKEIDQAIEVAKTIKNKPSIIIAKTIKGKGVSYMEGKSIWHGKPLSEEDYKIAMEELGGAN